MPGQAISDELQAKIYELGQRDLSVRDIARQLKISRDSAARYRDQKPVPQVPKAEAELYSPSLHEDIRKLLKRGPLSSFDLADALDLSPKRILAAIDEMTARGSLLMKTVDGRYDITPSFAVSPGRSEALGSDDEWTHRFGIISDNHLCNRHSRLDVLNAAYDTFARAGILTVYNGGNWIDGEARFNKTELVTAPGMDHQLDYMIDKYPQRHGITTHYIAGDDHEGWYTQREGVEVGKYLQFRAEDQGRHDLKYLGYAEADIALMYGDFSAVMRLVHPGGGSAYAISYTDQKRVESYQGGEKPAVEIAAHYHKFNFGYPREVWTLQSGCTCDQTMFMRKKRLAAHVGFSVLKIQQDKTDGHVKRCSVEWNPFYDRGYYENLFA